MTPVFYRRLRVRDINDAIRELGQMVSVHTGAAASTFTKLTVLQEAVRVITDLENRLRGIFYAADIACETPLPMLHVSACSIRVALDGSTRWYGLAR